VNNSPASYGSAPSCAAVIGAGGGIGAALTESLKESNRYEHIFAFARDGHWTMDITREDEVAAAAARVAASTEALRLIVIATGFLHDEEFMPERSWRDLDPRQLQRAFLINAIGPALVMKHFLPLLPRQGRSACAALSARVGSIEDNRLGGWHSYRASKAALNQLVRTCAVELKRTRPEAICVALHPGTTATRLSQPFAKKGLVVRTPREASKRLLTALDGLTPEDTGGFFDYSGSKLPW
jgi:NAD(P)-dependent dehydrogenase (short-subunit alcohol dehydrogenase family)